MKNEFWFRVKYGFGVMDKISIRQEDLQKAIYAQRYGAIVELGGKQINGKYIISIEPDYHKYTGWYPTYEPKTGEDFEQIKRDCPDGIDNIIKIEKAKIDLLLSTGRKHLIGKNPPLPELKQLQ